MRLVVVLLVSYSHSLFVAHATFLLASSYVIFFVIFIDSSLLSLSFFFFFFFNDTATTEIYTLSLHDALPIFGHLTDGEIETALEAGARRALELLSARLIEGAALRLLGETAVVGASGSTIQRSEEHTSELQSPCNLVCRLLLEKKKKKKNTAT